MDAKKIHSAYPTSMEALLLKTGPQNNRPFAKFWYFALETLPYIIEYLDFSRAC